MRIQKSQMRVAVRRHIFGDLETESCLAIRRSAHPSRTQHTAVIFERDKCAGSFRSRDINNALISNRVGFPVKREAQHRSGTALSPVGTSPPHRPVAGEFRSRTVSAAEVCDKKKEISPVRIVQTEGYFRIGCSRNKPSGRNHLCGRASNIGR